ncbi:unnamed protein product, partial [Ectocarpus sp. 12 AP-2014]
RSFSESLLTVRVMSAPSMLLMRSNNQAFEKSILGVWYLVSPTDMTGSPPLASMYHKERSWQFVELEPRGKSTLVYSHVSSSQLAGRCHVRHRRRKRNRLGSGFH